MSTKRYWRIVGYDSTEKVFDESVPLGSFSQKQMTELLRVLAAQAGLTLEEIVDSYSKRNAKRYKPLLEVHIQSKPKFCLMCGSNPHFSASVVEK